MTETEALTEATGSPGDDRVPILRMVDIWQVFGDEGENRVEAVKGASLDVWPGEMVAITGPSGSGKSTFLHIVGLLEKPYSGSLYYRGLEVSQLSDARVSGVRNREVGFIFQAFHLLPRLSALENVELPLLYRGIPRGERHDVATEALDLVGLSHRLGHKPAELSGGQRQRVAVARALAGNPGLILADEPTGNLDTKTGREVMAMLTRLNAELGVTLVLITHDPEVASYAGREYKMRDGELHEATPAERAATLASIDDPETLAASGIVAAPGSPLRKLQEEMAARPAGASGSTLTPDVPPTTLNLDVEFRLPGGHLNQHSLDDSTSKLRAADLSGLAFATLRGNRLRTALTSLGVIIGVMAVVLLVALGAGIRNEVTSQIQGLGSNLILAIPGEIGPQGGGLPPASPMKPSDIEALELRLGEQADVGGGTQDPTKVSGPAGSVFATLSGGTPNFIEIVNRQILEGRYFSQQEYDQGSNVVALGTGAKTALFGGDDPIGQRVTIKGRQLLVIGTVAEVPSTAFGGFDPNLFVYAPLTTLQSLNGTGTIDQMYVKARGSGDVSFVSAVMDDYLKTTYPDTKISVLDQKQFLSVADSLLGIFTLALAGIAGISLVVGGIGIMNVTLVAVTERTREIGVRRAVGAQSRHVMVQFLVEAIVTSSVGGLLGLTLAWVIALGINAASPIPAVVTGWSVGLALFVSLGVGVFFGVWPARRAARLDPVEALRYE